jgi:hypothetical protein
MIRRFSCVAFWLLLLAAMLLSPDYAVAQDKSCSDNWCRYLILGSDPATYVYNNLWNTRGARGKQSITLYDGIGETALWSTTWDWKRGQGYTVTSYASTVAGWHWGEPFETPGTIPVPLNQLQAVTTAATYRYVPDSACSGKRAIICRYDVAYDLWFHDHKPNGGDAPAFELMVWLDYSWHDLWIGYTPIFNFTDSTGTEWKVFQTASTNAVFVPDATGMPNGERPVNGVSLNLVEFIQEAKTKGLINGDWWLSSVEFGIEVYQGKGKFFVDDYTLDIDVAP